MDYESGKINFCSVNVKDDNHRVVRVVFRYKGDKRLLLFPTRTNKGKKAINVFFFPTR